MFLPIQDLPEHLYALYSVSGRGARVVLDAEEKADTETRSPITLLPLIKPGALISERCT